MKEYKYDTGKPKLSLVPQQILTDIARIREYGVAKYGDAEIGARLSRSVISTLACVI